MVLQYSLFRGCLIPSRFPYIEVASRKVLDRLGVKLYDIEQATCCPTQMVVQSSDKALWQLTAARNLALAEEKGYDIITFCNGCYDTLKTVNNMLKTDDRLRAKLNNKLRKFGTTFQGTIEVKHILEVLTIDIGTGELEKSIKRDFYGLVAGTHYGCHLLRVGDHLGFDSPENPNSLDELVSLLGIKTVSYPEKLMCCGGGLRVTNVPDALGFARGKLLSIEDKGANCMVVACPYCMVQYDLAQKDINEMFGTEFSIPVFYITELLGLAMGSKPEELALSSHETYYPKKKELLDEVLGKKKLTTELYDDIVTREQLKICYKCGACADDCPAAMTTNYHPEELFSLALSGRVEDLLQRNDIWLCMNCHECIQRCPQGFGTVKFIVRLKNLAVARGLSPAVIDSRSKGFAETGFAFKPNLKLREELGLPQIKGPNTKALRSLTEKSGLEKIAKPEKKSAEGKKKRTRR